MQLTQEFDFEDKSDKEIQSALSDLGIVDDVKSKQNQQNKVVVPTRGEPEVPTETSAESVVVTGPAKRRGAPRPRPSGSKVKKWARKENGLFGWKTSKVEKREDLNHELSSPKAKLSSKKQTNFRSEYSVRSWLSAKPNTVTETKARLERE